MQRSKGAASQAGQCSWLGFMRSYTRMGWRMLGHSPAVRANGGLRTHQECTMPEQRPPQNDERPLAEDSKAAKVAAGAAAGAATGAAGAGAVGGLPGAAAGAVGGAVIGGAAAAGATDAMRDLNAASRGPEDEPKKDQPRER
jgi:hypothetical protein